MPSAAKQQQAHLTSPSTTGVSLVFYLTLAMKYIGPVPLLLYLHLLLPSSLAYVQRWSSARSSSIRTTPPARSRSGVLWGTSDHRGSHDDEDERYFAALEHNARRTDFGIFLTQRSIQSFISLLITTRDPHTVRWMEKTYDFKNLDQFHGTGAFNLTKWTDWDSILVDMVTQPKSSVIVKARNRAYGYGRLSKNNPYMEERFLEFQIDIDPLSLVSRIVAVREQIAKEWVDDLDTLVMANDQILSSYYNNHATARDDEEECPYDEDAEDCISTEYLTAAYSDNKGGDDNRRAFDRVAMILLGNAIDFNEQASSPYRKGNFDLLLLLATQESIHRVLRAYREQGEERKVSFEWLRDFYVERVAKYFDGHQRFGRADDMLEELMLMPPSMKTIDDTVELIDPLRIAEDIISERSVVGRDWKELATNTPLEHVELRKSILSQHMTGQPSTISLESCGEFE